jgi:mRNA-degrading endonuclease RelE of RelBE toxin-antitoxin system
LSFQVKITHQARKELRRLPAERRYQLLQSLKCLEEDPSPDGDVIQVIAANPNGTLRRLRVGEYPVFFEVEGREVFIVRCVHRQALEKAIRQLLGREEGGAVWRSPADNVTRSQTRSLPGLPLRQEARGRGAPIVWEMEEGEGRSARYCVIEKG